VDPVQEHLERVRAELDQVRQALDAQTLDAAGLSELADLVGRCQDRLMDLMAHLTEARAKQDADQ